jgi:hypothetical protein
MSAGRFGSIGHRGCQPVVDDHPEATGLVAGQGAPAPRPLRAKVVAWLRNWPLNAAAV